MERPLDAILNFFRRLGWPATLGLSLLLLAGSLVVVVMVALRWPVDQFKNDVPPPFWASSHPVVRVLDAKTSREIHAVSLRVRAGKIERRRVSPSRDLDGHQEDP